ncbi:MAG: hypothetical protein M3R17_08410 [Bacteroidota bacterium]|nr:hypothetical protein [Bacteroidota bacterium]
MNHRLQKLISGSKFAGLEIQLGAEGMILHLVILKRKGKTVVVEKQASSIESIDRLSEHLTTDIPVNIAFTGKGILHRRIAADPLSDQKTFLSKVLPNASLKDFYLQSFPAVQDEQFISVLRKSVVDEVLLQLSEKEFSIVGCSIGSLAVVRILPLLAESKEIIRFGKHELRLQDQLPEEILFSEETCEKKLVDAGGQKVEGECLLAFAVAFEQVLPEEQRTDAHVDSLLSSKEDFFQRKLFKAGALSLVVGTLLLLLVNYFVFSAYWSEKNELESKMQSDGGAFIELGKMEKEVSVKKEFLGQAGLIGPAHHAYYADLLAAELPNDIRLTRMALSPRLKLSEDDSIGFKTGRVEINGSCAKSVVLNSWLQGLKEKKWVRSAVLETYIQDKNMQQGEFQVALELE